MICRTNKFLEKSQKKLFHTKCNRWRQRWHHVCRDLISLIFVMSPFWNYKSVKAHLHNLDLSRRSFCAKFFWDPQKIRPQRVKRDLHFHFLRKGICFVHFHKENWTCLPLKHMGLHQIQYFPMVSRTNCKQFHCKTPFWI